ncbi:MAG: hypothetical protein EOM52_09730 [Clostridia bacterium]|nr:hypothetical protein [Clostridia bacterium]
MERKNRIVFLLLIVVVIAAALLASFGPAFFRGGTSKIVLPDVEAPSASQDPEFPDIGNGRFVPVGVTADTVQSVIATLERPASYSRTIALDTFSGGRQYTATAKVWVDGGWTRVDMTQPSQARGIQHTIVGGDKFYRWYGADREAVRGSADQWDADLAQRIPSYQDIIDLDQGAISKTDYVEKDGLSCIYVEVSVDELGYSERYWVSVSNGLLMSCETLKNGEVVLRMTSNAPESPVSADASFALPDGTLLHRSGAEKDQGTSE